MNAIIEADEKKPVSLVAQKAEEMRRKVAPQTPMEALEALAENPAEAIAEHERTVKGARVRKPLRPQA